MWKRERERGRWELAVRMCLACREHATMSNSDTAPLLPSFKLAPTLPPLPPPHRVFLFRTPVTRSWHSIKPLIHNGKVSSQQTERPKERENLCIRHLHPILLLLTFGSNRLQNGKSGGEKRRLTAKGRIELQCTKKLNNKKKTKKIYKRFSLLLDKFPFHRGRSWKFKQNL